MAIFQLLMVLKWTLIFIYNISMLIVVVVVGAAFLFLLLLAISKPANNIGGWGNPDNSSLTPREEQKKIISGNWDGSEMYPSYGSFFGIFWVVYWWFFNFAAPSVSYTTLKNHQKGHTFLGGNLEDPDSWL